MDWIFRQSYYKGENIWVYIINSGVGVTDETLFEPYYYLLFGGPDSFLGEIPGKIRDEFNKILS